MSGMVIFATNDRDTVLFSYLWVKPKWIIEEIRRVEKEIAVAFKKMVLILLVSFQK